MSFAIFISVFALPPSICSVSTASLKTVTLLGEIFYPVYIKNFIHQFIHSPQKNVRAEVGPVGEGGGRGGGGGERGAAA